MLDIVVDLILRCEKRPFFFCLFWISDWLSILWLSHVFQQLFSSLQHSVVFIKLTGVSLLNAERRNKVNVSIEHKHRIYTKLSLVSLLVRLRLKIKLLQDLAGLFSFGELVLHSSKESLQLHNRLEHVHFVVVVVIKQKIGKRSWHFHTQNEIFDLDQVYRQHLYLLQFRLRLKQLIALDVTSRDKEHFVFEFGTWLITWSLLHLVVLENSLRRGKVRSNDINDRSDTFHINFLKLLTQKLLPYQVAVQQSKSLFPSQCSGSNSQRCGRVMARWLTLCNSCHS